MQQIIQIDNKYKKLVLLAGFASVATACTLILMKAAVWWISSSSAVLASLTDSLIDLMASAINLVAIKFAIVPADKSHRFGHFKAEALASLCQAAFIGGSSFLLIFHGIERVFNPIEIEYADYAIIVSIISIFITIALILFQSYVVKVTKSLAIGADRYHYLSDIGLNVGVVISLVLSIQGFAWADGVFAVLLGFYILKGSYHIGIEAISVLLDKAMTDEEHENVMKAIISVDGVISVHDLKTRRAGPQCFIQCHLVLSGSLSLHEAHQIADKAERAILALYPDADINMHMEPDCIETTKDVKFRDFICVKD